MKRCAEIAIVNRRGLHARAAARFVKLAEQFDAKIEVVKDGMRVEGLSILELLMLGAQKGTSIMVETEGEDAQSALDALRSLIGSGFGETD